MLSEIIWDINPEIVRFGDFAIRWYGLLFASAFMVGQYVMSKMYKQEGKKEEDVDTLLMYTIAATVLGARLGHCLFYEPEYYLANPLKILMVWEGGLASHGAAIGILLGIYLYSRTKADQSYLWLLDRVVIVVALGGAFIRFGNLMNSEIVGLPTDLAWGFVFVKNNESFARHPAQLYESISSLLLFFSLYALYNRKKEHTPQGQIFGIFLIVLFGLRIVYEFFKENQVGFENGMPLNMGQILSIPLILAGFVVLFRSFRKSQTS